MLFIWLSKIDEQEQGFEIAFMCFVGWELLEPSHVPTIQALIVFGKRWDIMVGISQIGMKTCFWERPREPNWQMMIHQPRCLLNLGCAPKSFKSDIPPTEPSGTDLKMHSKAK